MRISIRPKENVRGMCSYIANPGNILTERRMLPHKYRDFNGNRLRISSVIVYPTLLESMRLDVVFRRIGLAYFIVTWGGITSSRKPATLLSGHNIEESSLISMVRELNGVFNLIGYTEVLCVLEAMDDLS